MRFRTNITGLSPPIVFRLTVPGQFFCGSPCLCICGFICGICVVLYLFIYFFFCISPSFGVCLFVLRFYGPVNPMGSCRAWSVYLTTLLQGRLSPLSRFNQYCAHSFARNWQLPILNQRKGENDYKKYFMSKSPQMNVANSAGVELATYWSPVWCASNWATEAGFFSSRKYTYIILTPLNPTFI